MNKLTRYIMMAIAMLLLQSCGLKGDLYRVDPEGEATEGEVSESDDTRETLPPMPEVEASMDGTGAGVAEDMETVEGLASPEETDEPENDDVLGDAPITP
jgi:predicted small lipoprotein YifL